MTHEAELVSGLRLRIQDLEAELAIKDHYIQELRDAIDALMQPARSELLAKNRAHPSRR